MDTFFFLPSVYAFFQSALLGQLLKNVRTKMNALKINLQLQLILKNINKIRKTHFVFRYISDCESLLNYELIQSKSQW